MGNFKDSLKAWFFNNSSQAATATSRIPLLDASGNPIGSDTLANIAAKQPLSTGNVGIAIEPSQGSTILFLRTEDYNPSQDNVVGVWVMEKGKCIIAAPYVGQSVWGDGSTFQGTKQETLDAAFAHLTGRAVTEEIADQTHFTAAYNCQQYQPQSGTWLTWYLGSFGEMAMIFAHFLEFERAMKKIDSSINLSNIYLWTSSVYNNDKAWFLGTDGSFMPLGVNYSEHFIPITSVTDGNF